ncbi:hypothetical protein [Brucella gallinifaecis]|uniref:hypothetical protein n=1 Tax=Brucella gallinifaecis TaxID=215590 RepID=UPI0023615C98|nr:hypothetical protein [Brucella gallinifaecis]
MKDQFGDRVTTAVATVAAVNPAWLLHLEKVLSIGLSSLGIIWLLVQIFYKVKNGK